MMVTPATLGRSHQLHPCHQLLSGGFVKHRVEAELVANVMLVEVRAGDQVHVGDMLALLESMKMEIPVESEWSGVVLEVGVTSGDVVNEGDLIALIESTT
jgi:acetyl-CoA carboxylase biotin carboxyl carrier protein